MSKPVSTSAHLRRRLPLSLLLILAALLRIAAIGLQWSELSRDPDGYRRIAQNLLQQGVYSSSSDPNDQPFTPTAFRPPLYPLSLTVIGSRGVVTPLGVALLHVTFGVFTVMFTYRLARAWRLESWSYLAAVLVAVDPILLNQASQVMTETLATLLAVLTLLAFTKWSDSDLSVGPAVCAGFLLGLASLCRPTFLVFAALSILYAAVGLSAASRLPKSRPVTSRCLRALAVAFSLAVVLIPWGLRNQAALGKFVITTTHGGYTLLLGNNRFFYRHLREQPWGEVWDAASLQQELASIDSRNNRGENPTEPLELVQDRYDYQLARQTIRDEPGMFVYSSLVRMGRLWTPLPHRLSMDESWERRAMRYAVAAWYTGTLIAVLGGIVVLRAQLWRTPWVWAILLCFSFTVVHSVYWSNMRMRAPLMPAIYLIAVSALAVRSAKQA
jgi:4-amino-4-deoxy-L-arabinose transferase-like glycosyltransferase